MLTLELRKKFERIIEINDLDLSVIDKLAMKDANILRPIKGAAFEVYFKKILQQHYPTLNIEAGPGDSDVDLTINGFNLQLKTIDSGSTKVGSSVGVALHKTHGNEKRPYNLYKQITPTFDFLVVMHPASGIMIVPYNAIPGNSSHSGCLADPAKFDWNNEWINRWDLLGFNNLKNRTIDSRAIPSQSTIPFISSQTYLQDFEIIEMFCQPEYFRAAVMGLNGNIKEIWFIDHLSRMNLNPIEPTENYPKYDVALKAKNGSLIKVQVKGTSKNMCSLESSRIGVEIMGTHGQFPHRGYKKTMFDYAAVIISEAQLPVEYKGTGLHFVIIPMLDLPLHYKIGIGNEGEKWKLSEYNDVIYPNIKLKFSYDKSSKSLSLMPDISSYKKAGKYETIPADSVFRKAGPYILDKISIKEI